MGWQCLVGWQRWVGSPNREHHISHTGGRKKERGQGKKNFSHTTSNERHHVGSKDHVSFRKVPYQNSALFQKQTEKFKVPLHRSHPFHTCGMPYLSFIYVTWPIYTGKGTWRICRYCAKPDINSGILFCFDVNYGFVLFDFKVPTRLDIQNAACVWVIHVCSPMTYSYAEYDAFIRATWLIDRGNITHSLVCPDSFIHETWRIHVRGMTHAYVIGTGQSQMLYVCLYACCITWLIHMWDMTHLMCDMTHSYVIGTGRSQTWHLNVCLLYCMTHSYVRHDSFICETWLIHMWDMTHW